MYDNDGGLGARDYVLDRQPIRFAVLDLETTGLAPDKSNIVEIAIVELNADGSIVGEWSSLVNAPGVGELGASSIHGITRPMLASAPPFEMLVDEIADRLRNRVLVGHVVDFDIAHLVSECQRANYPLPNVSTVSICTRDLAHQYLPDGSRTLESCCTSVGITISEAHSASGDSRATAQLFKYFVDRIEPATFQRLATNLECLAWPLRLYEIYKPTRATPRHIASDVRQASIS